MIDQTIPHKQYKSSVLELSKEMSIAKPGKIIAFIGVSGSGKSHTRLEIERWLNKTFRDQMEADRSLIPYISYEIIPPSADKRSAVSWKTLYAHLLDELCEPLLDKKRVVTIGDDGKIKYKHGVNEEDLGKIIADRTKQRGTKYIVLDESSHILRTKANDSVAKQNMDILKSLASRGETVIVMFGTYELLRNMALNSEVIRRVKVVTLDGYQAGMESDWQNLIYNVAVEVCGFDEIPAKVLVDDYEYFNQMTLGIPGILAEWFDEVRSSIEYDGKDPKELPLPQIRAYLKDREPSEATRHAALLAIKDSEESMNFYKKALEILDAPKMKKQTVKKTGATRKKTTKARPKVAPK